MAYYRSLCRWVVIGAVPILAFYLLVPLLSFFAPSLLQHVFFLNFVKFPFVNYSNLTAFGIRSLGRNFYFTEDDGVRLGCWHILPSSLSVQYEGSSLSNEDFERSLSITGYRIVLYLHGNSFDRSGKNRCAMYNVLSSLNFHVVTFDYRGYGDSSGFPTEVGLVEDAKEMFRYVKRLAGENTVFVWGHSMGTGVATAVVMELSEMRAAPVGLVLESPFNNLHDVVFNHFYAKPFRWLPWFEDILIKPLQESGLDMSSDLRIKRVNCPVLMLHAADDHVIPVQLGRLLRDAALKAERDVTYVEFDEHRELRHNLIHRARELPAIVSAFVEKCLKQAI